MLMSKVARTVLVFVLMFGPAGHARAAAILSIEPASQVIQFGQNASLDVVISDVVDLYAFQLDLAFNPIVLSVVGVGEGPFLPSGGTTTFIAGTIDNDAGTISALADSLIGLIPGVSGTGSLVELNFNALSLGTSVISLSNVLLLDSGLTPIAVNIANGAVGVVPEPSTLLVLASGIGAFLLVGWPRRHRILIDGRFRDLAGGTRWDFPA
jgi:adhesin HecA-like repeat protein